jgi:hypothetical protein
MAEILNSKVFGPLKGAGLPGDISAWLDQALAGHARSRFRLVLEAVDGKRQKKKSAAQILESIAVDGDLVWESGDYKFLFMAKKYFWRGEEIHITAGEALFLYRVLVLKERYPQQSFYLYHLRKRLGKEFLAGEEK